MSEDPSLYNRFNTLLEAYAPADLYRRALVIMITPVVLLQVLLASVLVSRYLDNVANVLARSLADESALLVQLYDQSDKSAASIEQIRDYAQNILHISLAVEQDTVLPVPKAAPVLAIIDRRITVFLSQSLSKPFVVDSHDAKGNVAIHVQAEPSRALVFTVAANRAQAEGTPLLLLFMALSTLAFMAIAVVFMRNQIKPILDLTAAAREFGKGRDVGNFTPSGATEVRLAGEAFIDMKRRIARHVEQRTTLLAGVSHDLRTILTRFKLELAVLGNSTRNKALHADVNEMQHMLEDYMAFVRGDGGEEASSVDVREIVFGVIDTLDKSRNKIRFDAPPDLKIMLKPNAFRRLLSNVFLNAMRFGTEISVSGKHSDGRLLIYIDDNGPGIPAELREEAFKPFTRLDEARNLDHSGSGLGLAIAQDIAQAHGGDIALEDSSLGGLRVAIRLPI